MENVFYNSMKVGIAHIWDVVISVWRQNLDIKCFALSFFPHLLLPLPAPTSDRKDISTYFAAVPCVASKSFSLPQC